MAETAVLGSHELCFLSGLLWEVAGVQTRKLLRAAAVIGDMDHEVGICDAMLSMELGHPGVSFGTDKAGAGVSRDRDND